MRASFFTQLCLLFSMIGVCVVPHGARGQEAENYGISKRAQAVTPAQSWIKQRDVAAERPQQVELGCQKTLDDQAKVDTTFQERPVAAAKCYSYRTKLVFSVAESRGLQTIGSLSGDNYWASVESDQGTRITALVRGRAYAMTLPLDGHGWQLNEAFDSGDSAILMRRRNDGRALNFIRLDPVSGLFQSFEKQIKPSQDGMIQSSGSIFFTETCEVGPLLALIYGTCVTRDDAGPAPFYQVGDCATGTRPILYIQGGPFGPSAPLARAGIVGPMLTPLGSSNQQSTPCLWFPRIATSSDSVTDPSFTAAIAHVNRQIVHLVERAGAGRGTSPTLVVAESLGSQAISDVVATQAPLDIVFFSSLLDEVGFANARGRILGSGKVEKMDQKAKEEFRDLVSQTMRAYLARPSNWRMQEYFAWMETVQTPILVRACARTAPTRVVVLRARFDPRGTSLPTVETAAAALCAQNGHRLEFVTAPGSGHVTKQIAAYGSANSALLRDMVANATARD